MWDTRSCGWRTVLRQRLTAVIVWVTPSRVRMSPGMGAVIGVRFTFYPTRYGCVTVRMNPSTATVCPQIPHGADSHMVPVEAVLPW